jgi:transcriptional regulator with XRE-family HTH domain
MENILKNVEAIRKEKRIKQEVIAAELGIKQSSYSSYITRESDITFSRLLQISNILGVSVVDIITFPEKYVPESTVKQCEECSEKSRTILHLNKYIELLEKKLEQ